jgi:hypothetical protein
MYLPNETKGSSMKTLSGATREIMYSYSLNTSSYYRLNCKIALKGSMTLHDVFAVHINCL